MGIYFLFNGLTRLVVTGFLTGNVKTGNVKTGNVKTGFLTGNVKTGFSIFTGLPEVNAVI